MQEKIFYFILFAFILSLLAPFWLILNMLQNQAIYTVDLLLTLYANEGVKRIANA